MVKLTLLLLMCFVSIAWQQNAFWSSMYPTWRMPFQSPNIVAAYDPNVALEPRHQQYQNFLAVCILDIVGILYSQLYDQCLYSLNPTLRNIYIYALYFKQQQKSLDEEGLVERSVNTRYQRPKADSRGFGLAGLLGFNYLANLILNSFSFTSTTFVTSTSTVTAQTIVTCYASALFATSTVACRRKRKSFTDEFVVGEDERLFEETLNK